jgi:hypothetical protein
MHGSILPVTIPPVTPWGNVHQHVPGVAKFIERLVQGEYKCSHARGFGPSPRTRREMFPAKPAIIIKDPLALHGFLFYVFGVDHKCS